MLKQKRLYELLKFCRIYVAILAVKYFNVFTCAHHNRGTDRKEYMTSILDIFCTASLNYTLWNPISKSLFEAILTDYTVYS